MGDNGVFTLFVGTQTFNVISKHQCMKILSNDRDLNGYVDERFYSTISYLDNDTVEIYVRRPHCITTKTKYRVSQCEFTIIDVIRDTLFILAEKRMNMTLQMIEFKHFNNEQQQREFDKLVRNKISVELSKLSNELRTNESIVKAISDEITRSEDEKRKHNEQTRKQLSDHHKDEIRRVLNNYSNQLTRIFNLY